MSADYASEMLAEQERIEAKHARERGSARSEAMTTEAKRRTAASELRRWCPDAMTHQGPDEALCHWVHGDGANHRLRLRRMLICSECEQGYFTQEAFDGHGCYSAY